MRWQSVSQANRSGDRRSALSLNASSLALAACVLMGAAALLASWAEADELVEGGEVTFDGDVRDPGMPSSNPRVKSLLATHPNEFVTICVAGCDGKAQVVQTLPKPVEKRLGGMRTTAAGGPAFNKTADSDSVICVAGCQGRTGEVVQRMPGLPKPKAAAPRSGTEGNEPLDVQ